MVNFKVMKRFGNTNFDLDYCRHFTPAQLRNIYNGQLAEDVELLIAELYTDEQKDLDENAESPTIEGLEKELDQESKENDSNKSEDEILDLSKEDAVDDEIIEEKIEEIKDAPKKEKPIKEK